jgi:pyruvate formate-lyase activating enzyme-like uncharacterized protein
MGSYDDNETGGGALMVVFLFHTCTYSCFFCRRRDGEVPIFRARLLDPILQEGKLAMFQVVQGARLIYFGDPMTLLRRNIPPDVNI